LCHLGRESLVLCVLSTQSALVTRVGAEKKENSKFKALKQQL